MIFTPFSIKRFPTHEVRVGNITIGVDSDIVIQTMCNTPAGNIEAGYKQSRGYISRCADGAFCCQKQADAESIGKIKELLLKIILTPLWLPMCTLVRKQPLLQLSWLIRCELIPETLSTNEPLSTQKLTPNWSGKKS